MNERIHELWRECVLKHTKDPMNWQTVADEFAESIIKECADYITEYYPHSRYEAFYMKKHFGVEA